jgi:hypothetical protein
MTLPRLHQAPKTPERILIDREEREAEAAAERAERLAREHDRRALNEAFARYAARHGWPEARGWAAAQAHFDPTSRNSRGHRAAGEVLFKPRRVA